MTGVHAQDCVRCDYEGTQVERGAVFMRDPVRVNRDDSLERLKIKVLGDIFRRAEELDNALCRSVGLQALKYLLRIVQNVGAGHELDGPIGHHARVMPALALVVIHKEHMV